MTGDDRPIDSAGDGLETMSFGGLDIMFDARVLRPRPWTVAQSEWAAELLADAADGPVLELCTGAGQIGMLAVAGSARRLVAVDVDPRAVDLARRNVERAGMADRVEVRLGGLDEVLAEDERFPIVIADPPWVTSDDVASLPDDPALAIDGGPDGLDVAVLCLGVMEAHLEPGGHGLLQLGTPDQATALAARLSERGVLCATEVRRFPRGVLMRVDRPI